VHRFKDVLSQSTYHFFRHTGFFGTQGWTLGSSWRGLETYVDFPGLPKNHPTIWVDEKVKRKDGCLISFLAISRDYFGVRDFASGGARCHLICSAIWYWLMTTPVQFRLLTRRQKLLVNSASTSSSSFKWTVISTPAHCAEPIMRVSRHYLMVFSAADRDATKEPASRYLERQYVCCWNLAPEHDTSDECLCISN